MREVDRIGLRRFEAQDFKVLWAMLGDAEVVRQTGFQTPQPVEAVRRLHAAWMAEPPGDWGVFAVVDVRRDVVVGWAMLKVLRGAPELGYMFPRAEWGRGYATEVSQRLLARAFDRLGVDRVQATVNRTNAASIRVLEKVGMQRTGTLDGDPDVLVYTRRRTA